MFKKNTYIFAITKLLGGGNKAQNLIKIDNISRTLQCCIILRSIDRTLI